MFRLSALAVLITLCPSFVQAQETSDSAEVFKQLDKNGDGKISPKEVSEKQGKYFDRLVRLGDKNDDGELTREEFNAALKPREPGNANGLSGNSGRRPQAMDAGVFFDRVDTNGDGKLTLKEVPEPVRDRLKPLFERLGKDEVKKEEFLAAIRRRGAGGNTANRGQNADRMFAALDTNKDGQLTVDEVPERAKNMLRGLLRRAGKKEDEGISREDFTKGVAAFTAAAQSRVPALVRVLDTNRDGKLSSDELSKASEHFDELDKNGDGQLDLREIMGFTRPQRPGQ